MQDVLFIPNPALGPEWQVGPDAWDVMDDVGDEVASLAQVAAPVQTGKLKASIEHSPEAIEHAAGVVIVASAPYALYVEYGTQNMDAEPFLRPALDQVLGPGGD